MFTVPAGEVMFETSVNAGGRDSTFYLDLYGDSSITWYPLLSVNSATLASRLQFVPLEKDADSKYLSLTILFRGGTKAEIEADSVSYWLEGEELLREFVGLRVPVTYASIVEEKEKASGTLHLEPFAIPKNWNKPVFVSFRMRIRAKADGQILIDSAEKIKLVRAVNTEVYLLSGN
jgi:hypothetical protein